MYGCRNNKKIDDISKLVWVFCLASLAGNFIEVLYCRLVAGVWMSRSSVIYGPFSIVWGLGAVVLTVVLSRFSQKSIMCLFWIGALMGGVYEYVCSIITEVFLGTVFWDYSHMKFHIGGRTNLLFMGFWGILSVAWIKFCYPRISRYINRVPVVYRNTIAWVMVGFMVWDSVISVMAMERYQDRRAGIPAEGIVEEFLDRNYQDELIEQVWPNMMIVD